MKFRCTNPDDRGLLAELNHQLFQDEGHRHRMTVPELEQRMRAWLSGKYRATIYQEGGAMVGYALFRERPEEIICGGYLSFDIGAVRGWAVERSRF